MVESISFTLFKVTQHQDALNESIIFNKKKMSKTSCIFRGEYFKCCVAIPISTVPSGSLRNLLHCNCGTHIMKLNNKAYHIFLNFQNRTQNQKIPSTPLPTETLFCFVDLQMFASHLFIFLLPTKKIQLNLCIHIFDMETAQLKTLTATYHRFFSINMLHKSPFSS